MNVASVAPPATDGICGAGKDMCSFGTPMNTGGTSAPYHWTCPGMNGGADTACTAQTTPHGPEDTFFAGERDLVTRVQAAGPLRGLLYILDPTADPATDDGNSTHASGMKRIAKELGVPEDNLIVDNSDFPERRDVVDRMLVVAHPTAWAHGLGEYQLFDLRDHEILHVAAAGNTDQDDDAHLWYPDNPYWENESWDRQLEGFATGKLILATFAEDNKAELMTGDFGGTVHCGLAKDYCYSVPDDRGWGGSSSAATALGALSFYLSQLWDTPYEVVNVLNVCAEDIGDPGIDEVYGRGLVSVACDTVRNRERSAVDQSVRAVGVSPIVRQMRRGGDGFGRWKGVNWYGAAGTAYAPLGVRSSLVESHPAPFAEIGLRRAVRRAVSVLGAYGHAGDSTRSGYIAVQVDRAVGPGTVTLHAGWQRHTGSVGIAGHDAAGADPVPFAVGHPDVLVTFTFDGR